MPLYHGITIQPQFWSMNACIKGPVSTSTSYEVAAMFSGGTGVIMEFRLDEYWNAGAGIPLFECFYISDYTNELEIFFIGGYSNFLFETIIKPTGENYQHYIFALNALSHFATNGTNSFRYYSMTANQLKMCFRIMSHQIHTHYPKNGRYSPFDAMPKYVKGLINRHFATISSICFAADSGQQLHNLFKNYFCSDNGWIHVDILTTVFPSVATLIIMHETAQNIWDSIYLSLNNLSRNKPDVMLKRIKIRIGKVRKDIIDKADMIIKQYATKFKELNWKMQLSQQSWVFIVIDHCLYSV
eukprot:108264_1